MCGVNGAGVVVILGSWEGLFGEVGGVLIVMGWS